LEGKEGNLSSKEEKEEWELIRHGKHIRGVSMKRAGNSCHPMGKKGIN